MHWLDWKSEGSVRKDAALFFNCVNEPLYFFPHGAILDAIPPPQLHLFLGIFNSLFDYVVLFDEWGLCEWWAKLANCVKAEYFGGVFEGNECRRMLNFTIQVKAKVWEIIHARDAVEAEDIRIQEEDGKRLDGARCILKILSCMEAFEAVVDGCFGWELYDNFQQIIGAFRASFLALRSELWRPSITPKMHVVFDHVGWWCNKYGRGLGLVSEQALESIHARFAASDKHLIKDAYADSWAEKKLRSVCEWNAMACVP